MALCPKVSSSSSLGVSWRMRRSPPGSASRARTTRLAPGHTRPGADAVGNGLLGGNVPLTGGAYRPASMKRPRSAESTRLPLAASSSLRYPWQPGHLVSPGVVFTVTWTRNPRSWARATARGSSSGVKFLRGAHPEAGACQIHRIRAVQHRHGQPLHIPGGGARELKAPGSLRHRLFHFLSSPEIAHAPPRFPRSGGCGPRPKHRNSTPFPPDAGPPSGCSGRD